MELFKITCVTCKAQLSVRNRQIIGQIVACPRCESMVQIEAPALAAGGATTVSPELLEGVAEEEATAVDEVTSDEVTSDDLSVPAVAPVAKYRLVAWTLGSFAVGAAIGGAVLFLRSDSTEGKVVEEKMGSEQVVAPPEIVEANAPIEVPVEAPSVESPSVEASQQPLPEEPVVEAEAVVVAKTQVVARPRVTNQLDALDLDPETLDLETLKIASEDQKSLATVSESKVPPKDTQPALASTLPAVRRDPDQQQGAKAQAEKLLESRFQALTVKAMPIGDFLNLISRLGGVPISASPQQLQMAGITSRQSVSLDAKDIRLAEALQRVLEPLHLEYTTEGGQVVIVRQEATKVRKIDYPLEDLLNSTTRLEDIVAWIKQLVVPAAEPAASIKTSGNLLSIEQSQQFQYQVLIFLERLRLAREIPLRSRFPVKRLAGSSANAALAERLRAPTTFTFSHYTPMNEIVRYWQQELGIPILVDWPALAELDLWPHSRIACAAENKPWSESLDLVLEPLGLGWRAAAGGVVEITSAKKVQTELQLDLYRLEQELGDQTDRVLSELRSIAGSSIAEKGLANLAYDRAGNVLIVLQPASVQRLVYQWLVDEKLSAND